jgi:hypothetical protein
VLHELVRDVDALLEEDTSVTFFERPVFLDGARTESGLEKFAGLAEAISVGDERDGLVVSDAFNKSKKSVG